MAELNDNFIEELFKASITSKNTLDILKKHMGYQHLPTEGYKALWKEITTFYELENKLPTIGILSQALEGVKNVEVKVDAKHILASVKNLKVEAVHDQLLTKFETYKREVDFTQLYKDVAEKYQSGKEELAIKYMAEKSAEIANFSIKDGFYDRVFADFEKRQKERKAKDRELNDDRITSGIHELDYYIRGGWKRGTSFLVLGMSGKGKSTFLRWCAMAAARAGQRVVLFSLEGRREQTLEALDACWSSTPIEDMEFGDLKPEKIKSIEKTLRNMIASGGEIFVHSSESFNNMTIEEARNVMFEIEKLYGPIDMALFDYLELFEDKTIGIKDQSGERRKRESLANKITDISIEFNCVTGSATQANDIPPSSYNDTNFVLTRHHISEFKGLVKPFSYFLTINQTDDESEQNVVRLYADKFRQHKSGQTMRLFQRMDINRFYDSQKTLKFFWDSDYNKKRS